MHASRFPLIAVVTVAALAACGGGKSDENKPADQPAGDTPATGTSGSSAWSMPTAFPQQGPELKDIDWTSFFPPSDDWKTVEQVFHFNNDAEPETLDPHLMTGVPEHNLALSLFEGLAQHHPGSLGPLPGVAEWWEISADGLTYTFHLRENAKFSNGDPITAEDFRWSWQRALEPTTASQYAYQFFAVQNAKEFSEGKLKDFTKVGCRVVDARTFVVTLHSPTPYFLDLCCFETLMPVHRATVEKHGAAWTSAANFVGNGPFRIREWKPRDEIVMEPNPHYWNRGMVRLKAIHAKARDDLNTAYSEYVAGDIDWLKTIPLRKVDEIQGNPDYYVWPYLGTYFFRFNTTKEPFDDVRVRRAFNLAVNKEEICARVTKAGEIGATAYVPPGFYNYTAVEGPAHDPREAKRLLAEAGFPEGKGFPEVEVLYNTQERHKQITEVVSSMWREVLGVRVKLRNMEWKVYLDEVDNLRYQVARGGWIGDYTDPNTFLDMFVKNGGNNNTGWSHADYDAAISEAAREQDPGKRMGLFNDAERLLVEGLPIMPLYHYVSQGLLRPRVKNLLENIRDLHPPQFIYLDGPPAKAE